MDSVAEALGSALSQWREGSDDHYYGAWKGGSKSSGGRPMTKSEAAAPTKGDIPRDQKGRMVPDGKPKPKPGLSDAQRRVEAARGNNDWGRGSTDEGLESMAQKVYQQSGHKEGSKPNEGDVVPFTDDYGISGRMVLYRGPDGRHAGHVFVADYQRREFGGFVNGVWKDGKRIGEPVPALMSVAVLPRYRGKGIGTAMYDWVQDHTDINLYPHLGRMDEMTPAGKAFAQAWLRHRIELERSRGIREASAGGDDHFYGAWKGGSAKSGGRPMTPSERAEAADWGKGRTVTPDEAYGALLKGESPNIKPSDVGAFMDRAMAGDQHPDLSRLQVSGTLSFGGKGLGLRRNQMPQLSHRNGAFDQYVERVRARGVKVTDEAVDPRTLQPTQNEISAKTAAGVLRDLRKNGQPRGRLTVSQDGYVLDGHHRWGAAVAHAFEQPGYRLNVTRIGMGARDLLKDALAFNREKGIRAQEIHEAYAAVDEAWSRMEQRVALREASDDDHFYGPWFGGPRAEGGRPGRGPTLEARRADMAQKVGAENVGNVGNLPGRSVSPAKRANRPEHEPTDAQMSSIAPFERQVAAEEMERNPTPGRGVSYGPERGMAVAPDGKVLWRGNGESVRIDVSSVQMPPGSLLTHFHPDETRGQATLSGGDIRTAAHGGITVRAFNPDGSWEQFSPFQHKPYSFNMPGEQDLMSWVKERRERTGESWKDAYRNELRDWSGRFGTWSDGGPMREADDDHFHGAWKGGPKSSGGRPMTPSEQAAPNKGEQSPKERFKELSRTPLSKVQPEEMTAEEAERRLKEAMPFTELRGIERLSPEARAEVVPTIEALRAKYPDAWPSRIEVRPREKDDGRKTLASVTSYSNVLALHDEFMGTAERRMKDEVAFSEGMGWFVGTDGGALRPHQAMVVHEWGHVIEASRAGYQGGFGGGVRVTSGSRYSHQDTAERWAEAFLKYHAGGSEQAALVDRTLDSTSRLQRAQENMSRWGKVRDEQWGIREAGDDDHYYGPWFGGSRAAGGRPGRGPSAEARRTDKQGGIRESGDSASDDMRSAMAEWREADDDDHFYGAWKGGSKASGGRPMTKAEQAEAKTSPKADPKATTAASEQARMERLAREPLSSVKAEPMNTHEAQVRLKRVFPEAELVGIEHLSPEARAEMVPMFEALSAKYPDVKPSRLRIAPRVSGSAAATTSHRGELSFHDEFMKGTADQWVRMNESTGWLIGTGGGKLTPYGSIVVHEWGHLLALRRTGKTSGLTAFVQKHTSTYGRRTPAEKWAEAFAAYHAGKHPTPGRVEAALAHRGEAVKTAQQQRAAARRAAGGRDNRTWYQRFTEADDDDHFYGAWRGGSKTEGGGPGRAPTLDERRRDMAKRVGAENVGVPPKERARRRDALRAAEEASPVGVPESAGRLTEAEAVKRLSAAMPNTRIEGLQWMHPQIRGEVVPMFEALAKAFPTHHPTLISVGGANSGNYLTRTAFREGAMGVTSGGVQITLNRKHFEDPARFQKMFDRCEKEAWFAQGTGMTPAQYVVTHEWGHQVNRQMNVAHRPDMLTPTSMYARKNYEERWAEAFTSWVARGVNDNPTRYVGDVLARRWPGQYGHLRDEGMLPSRLAEADDDDHFYGAWRGGSKAAGGGPGRAPTLDERRRDMARRVGAENVGQPPRQELKDAQERVAATHTPLRSGRITTISDSPDAADLKRWDDSMRNMLYRLRQQRGRGTTSHHTEKPGECSWVKTWPDGNVTAVYHHPETGKPVAGVRIEQLYAGPAIAVVEVHPGYRGQGIATKMYDWLTDHGPVDMVQAVGRSDSFTHQGKAFATAWLQHRIEVERARASVREADTEDHFYGAWKGGKASAGGHPMTHAERREAKANEALRRPMPKSPETRPEMLAQLARDAQDALNAPKPRRVMPEGPMSVQEAERRLSEAMPRTRLEGIDRMSPAVRGEVVPTFEMLAASFPDAHPRAIVVGSTKNNFVTSQTKPGVHATTDMSDAVIVLHERSFSGGGANRARTLLSYSEQGNWLVGGYSGSVTQHQGVVMHEWGHVVDARLFSGMGQRSIPHGFPSLYGRMDPTEGFAEAFVLHAVGATGYSSVADLRSAVTSERARRLSGWTQLRDREKTS